MTEQRQWTAMQVLDGIKWYDENFAKMNGVQKLKVARRIAEMLEKNPSTALVVQQQMRENPHDPILGDIARAQSDLRQEKFLRQQGEKVSGGAAVAVQAPSEQFGLLKYCQEAVKHYWGKLSANIKDMATKVTQR
ncbi:MAG: hypothetical protein IJ738_03720 [Alphaproteobacteria bacterium]|nr:hypothetical protein [Alphaproteobacteria bacterium]